MTYPNIWDTRRQRREHTIEPQQVANGKNFFCLLGGCLAAELRVIRRIQKTLGIPEPICPGRRALRIIGNTCCFGERQKKRDDRARARNQMLKEVLHLGEVEPRGRFGPPRPQREFRWPMKSPSELAAALTASKLPTYLVPFSPCQVPVSDGPRLPVSCFWMGDGGYIK